MFFAPAYEAVNVIASVRVKVFPLIVTGRCPEIDAALRILQRAASTAEVPGIHVCASFKSESVAVARL
jgi:hypothetical protein